MNSSQKYLIGIDWMMNMDGFTDVDGTSYYTSAEDGDMSFWNGSLA